VYCVTICHCSWCSSSITTKLQWYAKEAFRM